jgi:hypothetical protein
MKTKNIKTILPNYSAIASSDKYQIKIMKEKKLFYFESWFPRNCHFQKTLKWVQQIVYWA